MKFKNTIDVRDFVDEERQKKRRGFTLIEILVVIGIIAILAGVVLVAVNPARQFATARDSQRTSNVNALLNAIHQNIAEHRGKFVCDGTAYDIPSSPVVVRSKTVDDGMAVYPGDIARCLVPDYISALPYDPGDHLAHYTDTNDYDTRYVVYKDTSGRITASSTGELVASISVTR